MLRKLRLLTDLFLCLSRECLTFYSLCNSNHSSHRSHALRNCFNCELCCWQKLNEEALAHATMQYNVQLGSLRSEAVQSSTALDKEHATCEKLEAEVNNQFSSLFFFLSVSLSPPLLTFLPCQASLCMSLCVCEWGSERRPGISGAVCTAWE